jgi:hypothetical protein
MLARLRTRVRVHVEDFMERALCRVEMALYRAWPPLEKRRLDKVRRIEQTTRRLDNIHYEDDEPCAP